MGGMDHSKHQPAPPEATDHSEHEGMDHSEHEGDDARDDEHDHGDQP